MLTDRHIFLIIIGTFFLMSSAIMGHYAQEERKLKAEVLIKTRAKCPKCGEEFRLEKNFIDQLKEAVKD